MQCMKRRSSAPGLSIVLAFLGFVRVGATSGRAEAAPAAPGLEADLRSPQVVGTRISWTVTPPTDGVWDQRFTVLSASGEATVLQDFGPVVNFEWTPLDEGFYRVEAASRERTSGEVRVASVKYKISAPRAQAAVLPTRNPLVALYTARPPVFGRCRTLGARCEMRVVFQAEGDAVPQATSPRKLHPGYAIGFYVAGLHEQTSYRLRHELIDPLGQVLSTGPVLDFQTGTVTVQLPVPSIRVPRSDQTVPAEPIVLVGALRNFSYATDLDGHVVWYDDTEKPLLTRLVAGGTLLSVVRGDTVREADLLGNVVRSTTLTWVNQQLADRGEEQIAAFHHEVLRLPNGNTAVLASAVRDGLNPAGTAPMPVIGDVVLVLDRDFRVVWSWSEFDYLDVARPPTLGETCAGVGVGVDWCAVPVGVLANDWTHSNAIEYSAKDGSLLVSLRHQDWVIKVDYADGQGSGNVLWRFGPGGDFTIDSADPYPWHSHAHYPALLTGDRMAIYDNGNTRCALGLGCYSRGQVYQLDEAHMSTHLLASASLQTYSFALGSAQEGRGGGYHFGSGIVSFLATVGSTSDEVVDDALTFSLYQRTLAYRSFRLRDLYTPPPGEVPQNELPAPEPLF